MGKRMFLIFYKFKLKVQKLFQVVIFYKLNRRDLVNAWQTFQDKIEKLRHRLPKQGVKINKKCNNKYSIKIC